MTSYKKLVAPISVALLIIVAGLAFFNVRPSYVGPDPILDPSFQLWVGDPGSRRPMLWDLEYMKGPGDSVSLQEAVVGGKKAVELLIVQSGTDSQPVYAYLKQTMDGARLADLLSYDVGVWVLAEPCACNGTITPTSIVFGVEVNDGLHTLTFIFSDLATQTTILAHRFVYLPTQPGTWTYKHLNVTEQYRLANWTLPESLTFSLIFEVGGLAIGTHRAYVSSFQATKLQVSTGSLESSGAGKPDLLLSDLRLFSLSRLSFLVFSSKGLTQSRIETGLT
jgi:hypothetical protein